MGVGWVGASFSYTSILHSGVLLFRESKLRFGWSEQREIDTFTIQETNLCGMNIITSWLNNTCRFIHFILNDSCWNPYAICTSKSIKWFIKWSRKLGCNDQCMDTQATKARSKDPSQMFPNSFHDESQDFPCISQHVPYISQHFPYISQHFPYISQHFPHTHIYIYQ